MPQPEPRLLLQRVLLLERQQGFADRAAVGGLASFARRQLERVATGSPSHLQRVIEILDEYGLQGRRERENSVSLALQVLMTGSDAVAQTISRGRNPLILPAEKPGATAELSPAHVLSIDSAAMVAPKPKLAVVRSPQELDNPLAQIKVRKPTAEALSRVGVNTVRDLLYYFPRAHYDYSDTRSISRLRLGVKTTLVGTIRDVRNNFTGRGACITTATISDSSGTVAVRWFNQSWLVKKLPVGARIAISGEPDVFNGKYTFQPRDYELIEDSELTHAARLVPVYPLTKGLFQRSLRELIRRTLDAFVLVLDDPLVENMRAELDLPDLSLAVEQYHFPLDERLKVRAEQRLAFDELLLVLLGLLLRKREWQQSAAGIAIPLKLDVLARFSASLPFTMTGAQQRAIGEILNDMSRTIPMSRLLQGDVGSGKTVVAAAALLQVVHSGKQGVLMAPTEILAEQHHQTLLQLLEPFGVDCELLRGSTKVRERRAILEGASNGRIGVLVGTHALIQENVGFSDLGLAITDEQHRFGVEQRAVLRQKGLHPHVLAMTATPIPRTLSMTIYGDLDVSAIDEMPPGRLPVITTWSRTTAEAYGVVRDEVRKGRQAFIICPVIEESADSDMRSVLAEHRELRDLTFADLEVGLLHGRMKPRDKDAALQAFRRGELHILVATSVVEVGIDVPNATVMVIRDAHRFGLAQLHQFRGRVGRGGDQAFCVLLSPAEADNARQRLEALTATETGFDLAEEDLRLRGPGEFWGTRQSGLPELRVAQLGDLETIQLARSAAEKILARDPDLTEAENAALREQVSRFWQESADLS